MKNNEYTRQAKNFLRKNNAKISITFKEVKRNPWNETGYGSQFYHNIYRVRIDRNHKTFSFDFTDSANNYQTNNRPTAYDILACLTKYEVGSYADFCREFGYEPYDFDFDYIVVNGEYYNRKSWNTYKAVKKEYENVIRLFGDVMEELEEIQ